MGGKTSKIVPIPVPIVLKRIKECAVPDDRNILVDMFEMLDIDFCVPEDFDNCTNQMKEASGISVMLRVLKRMIEDVDLCYVSIQLFETIKFNTPLVMDIIQYGGLDILDKAGKLHKHNEFIASMVPPLVKILLAVGAPASIEEIEAEALNLQLCQTCQLTIERLKKLAPGEKRKDTVPKSSERINKVLKFMDNFMVSVDVQRAGLDAVISFARNADAPRQTHETSLISIVHKSLTAHPNSSDIVWRVAMSFSIVASFSSDRAFEIALTSGHEILIDNYQTFKKSKDTLVMQQILWLFGILLSHQASRDILHREVKCIDFFKMVINDFDELQEQILNDPMSKKKGFNDDKLYLVVVPLGIRTFMRETGGELMKGKKKRKEKPKVFNQRRNFDERPKFGTVESTLFTKGEEGLLSTGHEDEFGNETRKVADWEERLEKMHI